MIKWESCKWKTLYHEAARIRQLRCKMFKWKSVTRFALLASKCAALLLFCASVFNLQSSVFSRAAALLFALSRAPAKAANGANVEAAKSS